MVNGAGPSRFFLAFLRSVLQIITIQNAVIVYFSYPPQDSQGNVPFLKMPVRCRSLKVFLYSHPFFALNTKLYSLGCATKHASILFYRFSLSSCLPRACHSYCMFLLLTASPSSLYYGLYLFFNCSSLDFDCDVIL